MSARRSGRSLALGALVLAILVLALHLRVRAGAWTLGPEGIRLDESDTLRRLVRIERLLDSARPYPSPDPWDGYPDGTLLHWTLPMDGVILALDRALGWTAPAARPFEVGAIWSGPVLGLLSALAFAGLAIRWLGAGRGILTAALYAVSNPTVNATRLGNGDHQALQHLAVVIALLGHACLLSGRGGARVAALGGAALGLGLWVSTETMAVFLWIVAGSGVALLVDASPRARERWLALHRTWAVACLAVAGIATWIEQPSPHTSFEWDRISGFQLYPIVVFLAFTVLLAPFLRRWPTSRFAAPVAAAGTALAVGLLPLLLTPLGEALRVQLEGFAEVSRWARAEVDEYRPLFLPGGAWTGRVAPRLFTPLVFLLPLFALGFGLSRRLPASARAGLLVVALGLFALACLEVKLAHLFTVLHPALLVLGGEWWLERGGRGLRLGPGARRAVHALGAAGVAGAFLATVPPARTEPPASNLALRAIDGFLRELDDETGKPERSVLAPWTLAPRILYYGRTPVVASGYHRNLEGIRDSYRVLLSSSFEESEPILHRRRVGWIATLAVKRFLFGIPEVVPSLGSFAASVSQGPEGRVGRLDPRVTGTLFWRLAFGPGSQVPEAFELVYESPMRVPDGPGAGPGSVPIVRVYRVRYPESP